MILEALLELFYGIFDMTLWFNIPPLPDGVQTYIDTAFDYITAGAGVLANYVPLGYLMTLFTCLLAVDAGIVVYHFVMWVIRKIPVAGMS